MTEAEYDKFLHQQLVGIDYIRAPIMRRAFEQRHELLEALQAVAVHPWGYCFCPPSMGDMEARPDKDHCVECLQSTRRHPQGRRAT